MAFMRTVKVPPNSASMEEARHRVFDFFRKACRSIPSIMEIYSLHDVVTPSQLRSTIAKEIRKNQFVSNPKVSTNSLNTRVILCSKKVISSKRRLTPKGLTIVRPTFSRTTSLTARSVALWCHQQPQGNICGYYVCHNMELLVGSAMTNDPQVATIATTALEQGELTSIRGQFASFLLRDVINPKGLFHNVD